MRYVRFDTTVWSLIERARANDEASLQAFIGKYDQPIKAFIRSKGFTAQDAEDLAQEVFMTIFHKELLADADASKGRFRNLILVITKYTINNQRRKSQAQKRGGGKRALSLDEPLKSDQSGVLKDFIASQEEDQAFDELWIKNLISLGMDRLKASCARKKTRHYDALRAHIFDNLSYEEIGEKLNCTLEQVKQDIHQGRQKLKKYMRMEVSDYASSPDEYDDEIRFLRKYIH